MLGGTRISFAEAGNPACAAPEQNDNNYNQALMFFNQEQYRITEATVERIFPADENGPGQRAGRDSSSTTSWPVIGGSMQEIICSPFYVGENARLSGPIKATGDILHWSARDSELQSKEDIRKISLACHRRSRMPC